MRRSAVVPGGPRERIRPARRRGAYRRLRRNAGSLRSSAALAAALCVTLLLATRAATGRSRTSATDLAGRITELADENARLTIEYESCIPSRRWRTTPGTCWAWSRELNSRRPGFGIFRAAEQYYVPHSRAACGRRAENFRPGGRHMAL